MVTKVNIKNRIYAEMDVEVKRKICDGISVDFDSIFSDIQKFIPFIELKMSLDEEWKKKLFKESFKRRFIFSKRTMYENLDSEIVEEFFKSGFDKYIIENIEYYKNNELESVFLYELIILFRGKMLEKYNTRLYNLANVIANNVSLIENAFYTDPFLSKHLTDFSKRIKHSRKSLHTLLDNISKEELMGIELTEEVFSSKNDDCEEDSVPQFHISLNGDDLLDKLKILVEKLDRFNRNYVIEIYVYAFDIYKKIDELKYTKDNNKFKISCARGIVRIINDLNKIEEKAYVINNKIIRFYNYLDLGDNEFELFMSNNSEEEIKTHIGSFNFKSLSKDNFITLIKYVNTSFITLNFDLSYYLNNDIINQLLEVHGKKLFDDLEFMNSLIREILKGNITLTKELIGLIKIKRSLRIKNLFELLNYIIKLDIDIIIDNLYISFDINNKFFDEYLDIKIMNFISLYGQNVLKLTSLEGTKLFKKIVLVERLLGH